MFGKTNQSGTSENDLFLARPLDYGILINTFVLIWILQYLKSYSLMIMEDDLILLTS